MAAIAGDLTQKILGHSDADKAFRPWWDNLEDGVLYSFVVMGMYCNYRKFIFVYNRKNANLNYITELIYLFRYRCRDVAHDFHNEYTD